MRSQPDGAEGGTRQRRSAAGAAGGSRTAAVLLRDRRSDQIGEACAAQDGDAATGIDSNAAHLNTPTRPSPALANSPDVPSSLLSLRDSSGSFMRRSRSASKKRKNKPLVEFRAKFPPYLLLAFQWTRQTSRCEAAVKRPPNRRRRRV